MTTKTVPTRPPPRPVAASPPPPIGKPSAEPKGVRITLVGVEGIGKTSIAAYGADTLMLITPDELGYLTLYQRGLVPECDVAQPRSWPDVLALIESVAQQPGRYKTLGIDAMAGLESLCAWHVCQTEFNGNWGEKGFRAWNHGPAIVARTWPAILPRLTACSRAGLDVILLGHARVKNFKNPDGPDYDRYECNTGNDDVWARTKMWAEACLFLNFRPIIDLARPEANAARAHGKAIGQQRVMRCQYSAVTDAKNQLGLDPEYEMPDSPAECAAAFWNLIKGKTT